MLFKKFLLLLTLIAILFTSSPYSAVKAVENDTNQNTAETTTETTSWWDPIKNLFGLIDIIRGNPTSKPIPIDTDISENMNYNSSNFDQTTRSRSYIDQKKDKGKYFFQVINQTGYPDKEYTPSGCNSLKVSQVAYYFYTKKQKILYDLNNKLVDYDSAQMEKYKPSYDPDISESCYTDFYDRMPSTPQGEFNKEPDTAAASSTQLNYTQGDFIPAKYQSNIPNDNSDPANTQKIIEDNDAKEVNNIKWSTPQSEIDTYSLGIDRDYDRSFISHLKNPDSWQEDDLDDLPERDPNTPLLDADLPDIQISEANLTIKGSSNCSYSQKCNGKQSHCRGMSQYGAYGMAKSGKNFEEILRFYYGDIVFANIGTNLNISVNITKSDSKCTKGQTVNYNFETYLSGLGELSDEWGKTPQGQELFKAQVIAARTYAYIRTRGLTKSICNSSACQVFRCSNVGFKGKANLAKAVKATAGMIIIDATTKALFPTEYARSFCGSSVEVKCNNHTVPAVNAQENIKYEKLGHPKNLYCINPV